MCKNIGTCAKLTIWTNFLSFAVWIAAVVYKSGQVSFVLGINNFIFTNGHEIIMSVTSLTILIHPLFKMFLINNFSTIFHHKVPWYDIL